MSDTQLPKTKTVYQKKFEEEVAALIAPGNEQGSSLFRFIERQLRQKKIYELKAHDIFIEAYLRGLDYVDRKSEEIKVPAAWLRTTSVNIIQEIVRKSNCRDKVKHIYSSHAKDESQALHQIEFFEAVEKLRQALECLDADDRFIIKLRFEGKNFREIQTYYYELKGEEIEEATLRKRASRAMERLRLKFVELYGEV